MKTHEKRWLLNYKSGLNSKFRFKLSGLSSQAVKTYNQKETRAAVILSERSESKDLGTNLTANINEMRRSFDSAGAPLRMTTASLVVMLYKMSKPDSLKPDLSLMPTASTGRPQGSPLRDRV